MSEIPKHIDDELDFEEVHSIFASSSYGQELAGRPRWDRYRPDYISQDEWLEFFDSDVDNLQHHPTTYLITREFLRQCKDSEAMSLEADFSDEESRILLLAALTNDWAEPVVGDISYELKTTKDEEAERKEYKRIFEELIGARYVKHMHQVESVLFGDDKSDKLTKAFNAIERIGYLRTVLFGFEAGHTTDDEKLQGHLQWLAAGGICNHTGVLLEYSKIYPPVKDFLDANEGRISRAYDEINPDVFSKHGQTEKQKVEQFLTEKQRWESRKSQTAEEIESRIISTLSAKLSDDELQEIRRTLLNYGDVRALPVSKDYISRESYDRGIFGASSNIETRYVSDYNEVAKISEACKTLGLKVVLTSGTYDILHVGHARYLEKARQHGDVLIVGVDSDEKVKQRKGPNRPVVPEDERVAILSHLRAVDVITTKELDSEKWKLIKTVRPDTLIATAETYTDDEVEALQEYCGRVVVLSPQAEASTSARIRRLHVDLGDKIARSLPKHLPAIIESIIEDDK